MVALRAANVNLWSEERKVLEKTYKQELKDEVRSILGTAISRLVVLLEDE